MKRQKNGKERLMETKVNKSKVENKDTNKNSGNTENKRKEETRILNKLNLN